MKLRNIYFPALMLLLCLIMWEGSKSFPPPIQPNLPGPEVWPRTLIMVIAGLSLVLLVTQKKANFEGNVLDKRMLGILALTLLLVISYNYVGYYIASFVYVAALLLLFKVKKVWQVVAVPAVFLAGVYIVFEKLLKIYLP